MTKRDALSGFDDIVTTGSSMNPWNVDGERRTYGPDLHLVERLLTIPVSNGALSESGRFARAVDAWAAQEFRRAGFAPDSVWPRPTPPRVVSQDVRALLKRLPARTREPVERALASAPSIAPTDARILGRAYVKQVDVVMSRWDTGPELMLSTKAQTSSFGKNLSNRFEEAYGDAGNLRARHPLAAVGFLFVQRATILDTEPAAYERTVDMMRKLRDRGDGNGYTATGLLLVDWDPDPSAPQVHANVDDVPADLQPGQMFASLIETVLDVTPISYHVHARERMLGEYLATDEEQP